MSEYYLTKDELYHHGVKGQKWGLRQYQNPDGSLTPAGREHYGYGEARDRLGKAKDNLRNLREKQATRDFLYGDFGRITKKGRQLRKDIRSARNDVREARKDYKQAKFDHKRDEDLAAVKDYQKKFSKVDKLGDKMDDMWEKGLSDSKQYKKYEAEYAKLNTEMRQAYKKTGRNLVERVYNNIKYEKVPKTLKISKSDSAVTKRVKSDYNKLSEGDFKRKYAGSKNTYAKRVEKYGDPYMNSPLAKAGKKIKGNK